MAIPRTRPRPYVLIADRDKPEAEQSTWHMMSPSRGVMRKAAALSDKMETQEAMDMMDELVSSCLHHADNFRDIDGTELFQVNWHSYVGLQDATGEPATSDPLDEIGMGDVQELGMFCMELAGLSKDEKEKPGP